MSFHQRRQSGQLVSRIMNDLSTIRDLLSFGAVFMMLNLLQITVVTVCLLAMYWQIISHRLDAAEGADRVLLLDESGRIVADDVPGNVVGHGHPG
ncbi:hypothetical protein A4G28_09665 [Mycobacterium ostraviense]|uniref:ABC transmembrane type-1 domain-containing protein n=1 Tax=Mycobacterium ostraviense TaxID=2738409 RepID=A0A163Y2Q0_9MYCO|nr:hypothetical protein A4G28_09665 [Mycobacterium ostraviense]